MTAHSRTLLGLIALAFVAGMIMTCGQSTSKTATAQQPVLADSLTTRPIAPEDAAQLQLDSAEVRLGLNFSYRMVKGERDVALVERVIFATEFPYEKLLKLDSLGLISEDQAVYLITRRALVRGADSAAIARAVTSEPIVWRQSLPSEAADYCVLPGVASGAGSEMK
jgi:hypothetical protein